MARLHYLTTSTQGLVRPRKDAGLTVTDRTLKAWLEDRRRPSKANLERIDAGVPDGAPPQRRPPSHSAASTARAAAPAWRSTPSTSPRWPQPLQRVVEYRTMNVRRWDRIVGSWAAGDHQSLDDAWTGPIVDLGSQWGQYEYVTNVGFAA
jgi:hypothetical protein